jgi:methionyl-tRNA synthetase
MSKDKFYVTTPIYYVNAKPHLGTLYSTVLADVTARWNKLLGKETFFLTGTDEHGQKIEERAKENNVDPKTWTDSMIAPFKEVWKTYGLKYDKFIRTTDPEHEKAVIAWVKKLQDQGEIYKSEYTGWYCVPQEMFITVASEEIEKDENGNFLCPDCGRPLREVSEESYFFRLSAYQDRLLKFYDEHPNFITPKERLNEVVSFVKSGLKDLSISRKTVKWGIPFPDDPEHTVYVWGDALNNYISAVGYGQDDAKSKEKFERLWPADLHIIGKDIVRFHAVYWPAFLMAAELPLPKKILVHGFILMGEEKMSKSLGNIVDPKNLADLYGTEQVKYYLIRQMAVNQDGQFSLKDLEGRISSDLSNNLGNLLNRTLTLALDNGLTKVEPLESWEKEASLLREKCEEAFRSYWDGMNHYQYHLALADLCKFASSVNAYFHEQQPWKLAKGAQPPVDNKELFAEVISAVCHSLYSMAIMLWPILPNKMEKLLDCLGQNLELGINYDEVLRKNLWNKTFKLKKTKEPLFPKPESIKTSLDTISTQQVATKSLGTNEDKTKISINDFAKVELLVGTVIECDGVEGSEKLYKLKVDLGKAGKRTIFAGVAKYFEKKELVGKQGIFVSNLKPRKMMGDVSQGMMLFAEDSSGKFEMVTVAEKVENGTRLS